LWHQRDVASAAREQRRPHRDEHVYEQRALQTDLQRADATRSVPGRRRMHGAVATRYDARNAISGSTDVARRAGTSTAATDTRTRIPATPPSTSGSLALT